jgi:hypothetical protein
MASKRAKILSDANIDALRVYAWNSRHPLPTRHPTLYRFIEDNVKDAPRRLRMVLGILSTLGAELETTGIRKGEFFQKWRATRQKLHD